MHLSPYQTRCEDALTHRLGTDKLPLSEAMRYSLLNGGKRLRAALIYACGETFSLPLSVLDAPACAVEAIHAYSLIHDDLPAMDDDALRRGKPSCHIAFGEAMAILAGDALNTLAFEWLCENRVPEKIRLQQIKALATAAGWQGMVRGQALDMAATGKILQLAELKTIHQGKTAALITAALHLGALASEDYAEHQHTLQTLGETLGLAYQITDDILDATADSATLGKTAGKDCAQQKNTYLSHLGLEGSRTELRRAEEKIHTLLTSLPQQGKHLRPLITLIFARTF